MVRSWFKRVTLALMSSSKQGQVPRQTKTKVARGNTCFAALRIFLMQVTLVFSVLLLSLCDRTRITFLVDSKTCLVLRRSVLKKLSRPEREEKT